MLFYFACEAAGASSARHSLRPLIESRTTPAKPRAASAARSGSCVAAVVIPRNIATAWELFIRAIRASQGFCSRGEAARHPPQQRVASQECLVRYEFPVAVF